MNPDTHDATLPKDALSRHLWSRIGVWLIILVLGVLYARGHFSSQPNSDDYPTAPIQVVVPYKAGGGTDVFARLVQRAVNEQDLLGQPLVIVNQDGGSGTIGSRTVKQAKPDGYKILCHHDGIMTSRLSGTVSFGPEAFQPIAQTGDMVLIVVVHQEASWRNLNELMQQAKATPGQVTFGTNMGSPAHFAGRLLEDAVPGAEFKFVQSGGGANRYALLSGKHLDAGVFSLAEFIRFRLDGKIRALGLLAPHRHPTVPDIPTAQEQGIDVVSGNGLFWWAPKQTPSDRIELLADALERAMRSTALRNHAVDTVFRGGAELERHLTTRQSELASVSMSPETELPDFPRWTILITTVLLVVLVAFRMAESRHATPSSVRGGSESVQPAVASRVMCFGIVGLYVVALQLSKVDFVIATSLMIFFVGATISRWRYDRLVPLAQVALVTSLLTQAVFTRVFAVILP